MILKYEKNFDGYWTEDDIAAQLISTHKTFTRLYPDSLGLYIFDNSANHHKIVSDALNGLN